MDQSRGTLAIWLVAAVLATLALSRLLGGGEGGPAAPPVRIDDARGPAARKVRSVYVHVAGAVRSPGLHRLAAGSRVAAALDRAGGPLTRADLTAVNLAAQVEDGQQIVVPRAGAVAGSAAGQGAKIGLGSATAEQLEELDGIGPTLAERIVEYRDEHGGFRSVDELAEVDGIGEQRLDALRDAVQP